MPANQYQPIATGVGANALTPQQWAALTSLLAQGFQSGIVPSIQFNTFLRQLSVPVSAIAQFVADNQSADVLDDGSVANFEQKFESALQAFALALIASKAPAGTITGTGWWRDPTTGFTVEWGTTTVVSASGYQNVTFPRAFTTLFSVIASDNGASSWSTSNATFNGVGAPSPTSFQAQCASWNGSSVTRNVNVTFGWHAVGLS